RTGNNIESNAAGTDNNHIFTGTDFGCIEHSTGSGNHTATQHSSLGEGHIFWQFDQHVLVHQRLLCETAQSHALGYGLAVSVCDAWCFVPASNGELRRTAEPWFAIQALFTFATELHQACRHVVAYRKFGHIGANCGDYTGNLM